MLLVCLYKYSLNKINTTNILTTFFIYLFIYIINTYLSTFYVESDHYKNISLNIVILKKKGFYIKKGQKDGSIYLNIYKADFIQYIQDRPDQDGWVKLRIYERETVDAKGHTHNLEQVNIPETKQNVID
jgi:hypothetical protein